jgi:hypothetical protein
MRISKLYTQLKQLLSNVFGLNVCVHPKMHMLMAKFPSMALFGDGAIRVEPWYYRICVLIRRDITELAPHFHTHTPPCVHMWRKGHLRT